jgi:hypothetical protein
MRKYLISLSVLITLYGCHKEDRPSGITGTTNININSELKSQAFMSGSYWIYKNDSTSKIDCTLIYQAFTDYETVNTGHGSAEGHEYFEMFYREYYLNNLISSYWDRMFYDRVFQNPINYFDPHLLGGPVIYYQDTLQAQNYFDSLRVGNTVFYKVQEVSINSTLWYSAKSVGVVKKVIPGSINKGTWNLLRWKIVK